MRVPVHSAIVVRSRLRWRSRGSPVDDGLRDPCGTVDRGASSRARPSRPASGSCGSCSGSGPAASTSTRRSATPLRAWEDVDRNQDRRGHARDAPPGVGGRDPRGGGVLTGGSLPGPVDSGILPKGPPPAPAPRSISGPVRVTAPGPRDNGIRLRGAAGRGTARKGGGIAA